MSKDIKIFDNATLKGKEEKFTILEVNLEKIVADWQKSLFSFEWLLPDGVVRQPDRLNDERAERYKEIESAYTYGRALERPVLGLGMMDNVEIGSRKEVLLTLYSLGVTALPVHVPKSCLDDFEKFL